MRKVKEIEEQIQKLSREELSEAGGKVSDIEFVQKMRVRNGSIVAVTEYFNPVSRARLGDQE